MRWPLQSASFGRSTFLLFVLLALAIPSFAQDDFESGGTGFFAWEGDWAVTTDPPNAGTYCARSAVVADSASSSFSMTAFCDGISYAYNVSSDGCNDRLLFFVDGVELASHCNTGSWASGAQSFGLGVHVLEWRYIKDADAVAGSDAAWIDDVAPTIGGDGGAYGDLNANGISDFHEDGDTDGVSDGLADSDANGYPDLFQAALPVLITSHPLPSQWYFNSAMEAQWQDYSPGAVGYLWRVDINPTTVLDLSNSTFSTTFTGSQAGLNTGLWYLHVTAADGSGVPIAGTEQHVTFRITDAGISLNNTSHSSGTPSAVRDFSATIVLPGGPQDNSGLTYYYTFDQSENTMPDASMMQSTLRDFSSTGFANGSYYAHVVAEDGLGGRSDALHYAFLVRDAYAPWVNSPTHPDVTEIYAATGIQFQWTDPDGRAVRYYYILDSVSGTEPDNAAPSIVDAATVQSGLAEGVHWFHVRGEDAYGYLSETAHFRVNIGADADADALPDWWEALHGVDLPGADADSDGVTNLEEFRAESNPNSTDTDGDGWTDAEEIQGGSDPLDAAKNPFGAFWNQVLVNAPWSNRHGLDAVALNGKMWSIGGAGRDDVGHDEVWNTTDGVNWDLVTDTAPWQDRLWFSTLAHDGKLWLTGGDDHNDVWYSVDGEYWVEATANASWVGRKRHATTVFQGKMWVLGGSTDGDAAMMNDVWFSEDGTTWTQAAANAPWSPRMQHKTVVYDGKLWLTGGFDADFGARNDVWWTEDGINWNLATFSAAWPARHKHACLVYDGEMWILGGDGGWADERNDIWRSADGVTWERVFPGTEAEVVPEEMWPVRIAFGSTVYDGKLWVFGGTGMDAETVYVGTTLNDVWYLDGGSTFMDADGDGMDDTWEAREGVDDPAADSDSDGLTNLQEYSLESSPGNGDSDGDGLSDGDEVNLHGTNPAAQDSDGDGYVDFLEVLEASDPLDAADVPFGVMWTQATVNAPWLDRSEMGAVVLNDKMWLIAGLGYEDVWYSVDGQSWGLATNTAPWGSRQGPAVLAHDGRLWLLGGGGLNDVWNSPDGENWTVVNNNAAWSKRQNHAAVVYEGKMWVFGGQNVAGDALNDVWRSEDGVTWTEATPSASWSSRVKHAVVAFDRKLWVVGGSDVLGPRNDVWSSPDGVIWTEVLSGAPWASRQGHECVVYDGKLWILGGEVGLNNHVNDIWYTDNGVDWQQVFTGTAVGEAPFNMWSPRVGQGAVVFDSKLWLTGGLGYDLDTGAPINYLNDVWYLEGGASITDGDADGMDDLWETREGIYEPGADADADGLTNLQEYELGTSPGNADSDGDGLSDGDEVNLHGSEPTALDTDRDGCLDGTEVAAGASPVDSLDIPEDCLDAGDIHPDIPSAEAPLLLLDLPALPGLIDANGDVDFFQFDALLDVSYVIETGADLSTGSVIDTYLCLYDTDGVTELVCNDDSATSSLSRIFWTCPASGSYFVSVRHFSSEEVGGYSLALRTGGTGGAGEEDPCALLTQDSEVVALLVGTWLSQDVDGTYYEFVFGNNFLETWAYQGQSPGSGVKQGVLQAVRGPYIAGYLLGGSTAFCYATTETYDPATDSWEDSGTAENSLPSIFSVAGNTMTFQDSSGLVFTRVSRFGRCEDLIEDADVVAALSGTWLSDETEGFYIERVFSGNQFEILYYFAEDVVTPHGNLPAHTFFEGVRGAFIAGYVEQELASGFTVYTEAMCVSSEESYELNWDGSAYVGAWSELLNTTSSYPEGFTLTAENLVFSEDEVIQYSLLHGSGEEEGESGEDEGENLLTPGLPQNLRAEGGAEHILVQWEANPDLEVAGYHIYRATYDAPTPVRLTAEAVTSTFYEDVVETEGLRYLYWVSAVSESGEESELLGPTSAQAGTISVWTPDRSAEGGSLVSIPVNVENASGIRADGLQITLSYPDTLLEATSIIILPTSLSAGLELSGDTSISGQVTISVGSETGMLGTLEGQGAIFEVQGQLNVNALPGSCGEVVIGQAIFLDEEGVSLAASLGSPSLLCISSECNVADLNSDGAINEDDANLALDIAVQKVTADECQMQAGDLNGDGRIDSADAVLILRYTQDLPVNPEEDDAVLADLIEDDSVIAVSMPYTLAAKPGETIQVPVEISNPQGLAGMTLLMSFPPEEAGLRLDLTDTGASTSGFANRVNQGERFVRMAMASPTAITGAKAGQDAEMALLTFTVDADAVAGTAFPINLNAVRLNGVFADNFDWYTQLVMIDGLITVLSEETDLTLVQDVLLDGFETADADADSNLSFGEAVSLVSYLDREAFNALDTNENMLLTEEELSATAQTRQALYEVFQDADTNNDQQLSLEEAQASLSTLDEEEFDALDENEDSFLTEDELKESGGLCGIFPSNGKTMQLKDYLNGLLMFGLSTIMMLASRFSLAKEKARKKARL
jgi:hypothetical protein